jgi:uncharacterized protein (DUF488 family)
MNHIDRVKGYFENTKPVLISIDILKYAGAILAAIFAFHYVSVLAQSDTILMPFHRRLLNNPAYKSSRDVYCRIVTLGAAATMLWLFTVIKNFVKFTVLRLAKTSLDKEHLAADEYAVLPPYPYDNLIPKGP